MIPFVLFLDYVTPPAPPAAAEQAAPTPGASAQAQGASPNPQGVAPPPPPGPPNKADQPPLFYTRLGAGLGELAGVGFYRFPVAVGGFLGASNTAAFMYGLGYAYGRTPNGISIHEMQFSLGGRFASGPFSAGGQVEFGLLGFSRTSDDAVFGATLGLRLEGAGRFFKFEESPGGLELGVGAGARLAAEGLSPFSGDLFLRLLL